jgi:putative transposase
LAVEAGWLKKMQAVGPVSARRTWIKPCAQLSLRQQCELLGFSRSGYYYEPVPESAANLALMRRLDELNLAHPVYGNRRLRAVLAREGWAVNSRTTIKIHHIEE